MFRCPDSVSARHQRMAEFMRNHTGKERKDEGQIGQGCRRTLRKPCGSANPGKQQEKRGMDPKVRTQNATNGKGPRHCLSLVGVASGGNRSDDRVHHQPPADIRRLLEGRPTP